MKYTAAKNPKSSKALKSEKAALFGDKSVQKAPPKPSRKGKPRILGTGTFQKKEHSPRVI